MKWRARYEKMLASIRAGNPAPDRGLGFSFLVVERMVHNNLDLLEHRKTGDPALDVRYALLDGEKRRTLLARIADVILWSGEGTSSYAESDDTRRDE